MSEGGGKARPIDLGENFGDVVVKANGARIEVDADGSVHGLFAPANDAAKSKTAIEVGDKMADGTVYAGVSPDTGKAMYATPKDAPLTYTFNEAADYAAKLNLAESDPEKRTWHVPSKKDLNVLFSNRAAIGGFNEADPAGRYWSSSQTIYRDAWVQSFSDGDQNFHHKTGDLSLRLVR